MIPYLPPLQTLRAFEAAARHLSYTRAAQELSLTHGAISHHIARLERDLGGVRLFVRDGQRMLLTDAGQVLVLEIRAGLQQLLNALDSARAYIAPRQLTRTLTVSVLSSFAARWLMPRISAFQAANPEVDIALRPTAALATLDSRDGVDLAIRYGPGQWPGLNALRLMKSFTFPVCSPVLLSSTPITKPEDLMRVTLLRSPRQRWSPWFQAAGLDMPEPTQGPSYDDAGLLLQAAISGQGVALARSVIAADDLAAGRLIRVCDVQVEDRYGWFIAWREPLRCERQDFDAFRCWLEKEAAIADSIGL
ncbi:transcriptional regulator GcvA [Acerihabitans sp. KWT182]|uniref:Transcriptional regulator GcvA n=1 Tax=Acerihabitans sp. KWT182 TaxID=3157919 RepID=A0AAU7Q6U4_9GAMM